MEFVQRSLKAIVAGLSAFIAALTVVLVGDIGFGDVTDGQWLSAAGLALAAASAVWFTPNKKAAKKK